MNDELDMISFNMIAHAGDAKQFAFEALDAARAGDMEQARSRMEDARKAIHKARRAQTDLLFEDLNGQKKRVSLLLIHSQDHLMDALLALDLIGQMIPMQQTILDLQKRIEKLERGNEV